MMRIYGFYLDSRGKGSVPVAIQEGKFIVIIILRKKCVPE